MQLFVENACDDPTCLCSFTEASVCLACIEGYGFNSASECEVCPTDCTGCDEHGCTTCILGYHMYTDLSIFPGVSSCLSKKYFILYNHLNIYSYNYTVKGTVYVE